MKYITKNNISKLILGLLFGVSGFVFATQPVASEESFLFCIKPQIQPLEISRSGDVVTVDNEELSRYFDSNGIVDLEPWIKHATELDRDGEIYLNRIYRAYVNEDFRSSIEFVMDGMNYLSSVLYAEEEFLRKPTYQPNDPLYDLQCSLPAVKADKAWDFWDIPEGIIPEGQEILLASVDTGVDYTHPALQSSIWINQDEVPEFMFEAGVDSNFDGIIDSDEVIAFLTENGMDINEDGSINLQDALVDGSPFKDGIDGGNNGFEDDLIGWDPASNSSGSWDEDNDPMPKEDVANNSTWAHGTHVAGILAATTDDNFGIASTAYNAKIMCVKGSFDSQSGEPGINNGYDGITYAAKAGYFAGTMTIINNSWGGGGFSSSENSVINNAHNTYGAVILSAAGNGDDMGGEEYASHYPSSYDNSMSVAAMGCAGTWGHWATFHPTVTIGAPGESVYSAIIGGGYESWDGSSMASPNAASCVGLLKAYYPDWTNDQLIQRIYDSADRIVYELSPEYEDCNGYSGTDCLGAGMVDVYKAIGMDFSPAFSLEDYSYSEVTGDGDGVLNPGETGQISVLLGNLEGWTNASNTTATLSTDNPSIVIVSNIQNYGNVGTGESVSRDFIVALSDDIDLGVVNFNLTISALGDDDYQYHSSEEIDIEISIIQENYPITASQEVKSSPLIVDLDNDGIKEIIFGDYSGLVHIISDGIELENEIFPFDTGNQIWGSVASADLDNDGLVDFVVPSKSKSLYIFDINGLKVEYIADKYLMGTPAIGNLDDDDDLEIVIGGYSSSNKIFVVNHDGTDVVGFPFDINEKTKAGASLADFNNNGKDDIVVGTDSDNLYVILDDGSVALGFPVGLPDKIQSAPAILNNGGELILFTGNKDDNFYAINSDGNIRFTTITDGNVYTSPSFLETSDGLAIFFGSADGFVYAVDIDGNSLTSWPVDTGSDIVGSIVFANLDEDSELEIVAVNDEANAFAFNQDGTQLNYFPVNYEFPFTSSPIINDIDNDGDLEIVAGCSGNVVAFDIKNESSLDNSWSMFKGDNQRTGYLHIEEESCGSPQLGDSNCDSIINILDIMTTVNVIVNGTSGFSSYELWAVDINSDGIIDILDIVVMVNIIVNGDN